MAVVLFGLLLAHLVLPYCGLLLLPNGLVSSLCGLVNSVCGLVVHVKSLVVVALGLVALDYVLAMFALVAWESG